jgi:hypothetical protein
MRTKFVYKNHTGVVEERDVDIVAVIFDHTLHPEFGYNTPGWYVCGWDFSRERKGQTYRSFRQDNIIVPERAEGERNYKLLDIPKNWCLVPEDLVTHIGDWRTACTIARKHAAPATVDSDDPFYWEHQLATLDRIKKELNR